MLHVQDRAAVAYEALLSLRSLRRSLRSPLQRRPQLRNDSADVSFLLTHPTVVLIRRHIWWRRSAKETIGSL